MIIETTISGNIFKYIKSSSAAAEETIKKE